MTRPAGASLALALAAACSVAPARAQEQVPPSTSRPDVATLVEALRGYDEAERHRALQGLGEVAARRPQDLEPFLAHADPDVRFQLLYLLSERDARAEQRVRQIVEGRPALAATYPEALQARAALLDEADREARDHGAPRRTLELLVRLARRRAGAGDLGERYAVVALDLVADVLARTPPLGESAREAAEQLATLLEIDLGEASSELCTCFSALPPEAAQGALRAVIGGGAPLAQARAARVLGEIVDAGRAELAATAVRPLLGHAQPEVRLAALRALSVMPLGDGALVHAGVLARDPNPAVAEEALRLAGERHLGFVREAAEKAALDPRAPLQLRRQAIRTLGLLGNAASAAALKPLLGAQQERELRVLAAWALGAVRAPDALPALEQLLTLEDLADDDRLYVGLARLGPAGVAALADMLGSRVPSGRARRIRAIKALGRAAADAEGRGPKEAVDVLVELSRQPVAHRLADAGAVTENELELVARSLGDLAPSCEEARAALARLVVERGDLSLLDALLPIVAEVGPPLDPALALALRAQLAKFVMQLGGPLRPMAASALLRIDPAHAREVLTRAVGTPGRGGTSDDALELMRILARAGDPGPVKQLALRLARDRLEQSDGGEDRFTLQNRLGIELLYAGEWDEAVFEFRRMLWSRPNNEIASYNVACGQALAGRVDAALRAVRRCVRQGYRDPQHMMSDSDLDSLRGDARFQRLMGRLVLEDETGVRVTNDTWPRRLVPE